MASQAAPEAALGAGKPSDHGQQAEKTSDQLAKELSNVKDPQDVADLESALLYRESIIPKWRFVFLCVG